MGFQKGTLKRHHWKEGFGDVDLDCEGEHLKAHIVVIWEIHGMCSNGIGVRYGGGGRGAFLLLAIVWSSLADLLERGWSS